MLTKLVATQTSHWSTLIPIFNSHHPSGTTMVRDFLRIDLSVLIGSKVEEDPQSFIENVGLEGHTCY